MASSKQPSRVVFVGNIPYGLSEEQIIDIFSSAGKVLNFRLVYDQQTGKTRGYGFAEYPDIDSASSAVRNLHDYEVMGRKLRVDFSNEGPSGAAASASGAAAAAAAMPATHGAAASASNGGPLSGSGSGSSSLPPLPPGKELPPGVTCHDAISRTLSALPPSQLLDILQQMKTLSLTEPARCAELLSQAPQLSYAVFQALLLMGLISPEAIHSVVEGPAAPPYAVAQPAPPPAASVVTSTPPVAFPPGGGGGPGLATVPYGMPIQPAAAVPAPAPPQDPEALMKAVMALSQSTIDSLPENERQQVMQLRAAFSAQRR